MKSYNILFLCTHNSARSIMAEALATTQTGGRFIGYSAGSSPGGHINPYAREVALSLGYDENLLRSKSWDEFSMVAAPVMDFIITVCDNAKGESCPIWLGHPSTAHWGFPDPSQVEGDDACKRAAFHTVMFGLQKRIVSLAALPLDNLDKTAIQQALKELETA
jgi:protein-tyrosine-phosphatase